MMLHGCTMKAHRVADGLADVDAVDHEGRDQCEGTIQQDTQA